MPVNDAFFGGSGMGPSKTLFIEVGIDEIFAASMVQSV